MRFKIIFNDFIACLSLSNLIMIKIWIEILPYYDGKNFWVENSLSNSYISAIINSILIAFFLWLTFYSLRGRPKVYASLWLILHFFVFIFVLNAMRSAFAWSSFSLLGTIGVIGVIFFCSVFAIIFFLALLWVIRNSDLFLKFYSILPFIFAPFICVTFSQAIYAAIKSEPQSAFAHKSSSSSKTVHSSLMPVIWIIFDEFDYGIAFGGRPTGLFLPQLDMLKQRSVFVSTAYSPSTSTRISIPSLLVGRTLKATKSLNSHDMELTELNGESVHLSNESTIFSDMYHRGMSNAVFGWVLPYSRLFSNVNVSADYPPYAFPVSDNLMTVLLQQLRSLIESGYYSPFGNSLSVNNHISITSTMRTDVLREIGNIKGGEFVFQHFPIPHSPFIYSMKKQSFGTNRNALDGYLGNILLVDKIIGDIRSSMEISGIWDKSLVIVSSDHHWRTNVLSQMGDYKYDNRVPFLLKMPGQSQELDIDSCFMTFRTRSLILKIFDGDLRSPEEVGSWIKYQACQISDSTTPAIQN